MRMCMRMCMCNPLTTRLSEANVQRPVATAVFPILLVYQQLLHLVGHEVAPQVERGERAVRLQRTKQRAAKLGDAILGHVERREVRIVGELATEDLRAVRSQPRVAQADVLERAEGAGEGLCADVAQRVAPEGQSRQRGIFGQRRQQGFQLLRVDAVASKGEHAHRRRERKQRCKPADRLVGDRRIAAAVDGERRNARWQRELEQQQVGRLEDAVPEPHGLHLVALDHLHLRTLLATALAALAARVRLLRSAAEDDQEGT
mmetsp:Transcript_69231/g.207691  ORF Transcript_69231/g.207691 Transcript_69231/m.207691 type:complete len:260 (-) Transcript_69231:544-1323(-)